MDSHDRVVTQGQSSKSYGDVSIADGASAHLGDRTHHSRDVHFHFHHGDIASASTTSSKRGVTNIEDLLSLLLRSSSITSDGAYPTTDQNIIHNNSTETSNSAQTSPKGTTTASKTIQSSIHRELLEQSDRKLTIGTTSSTAQSSSLQARAMIKRANELAQKAHLRASLLPLAENLYGDYQYGKREFLCAETPQDPGDETSMLVAARFYSMAKLPKFVYIRDRGSGLKGTALLCDILETLIYQVAQSLDRGDTASSPIDRVHIPNGDEGEHELTQSIKLLCNLLAITQDSSLKVLIVIEGLEYAAAAGKETADLCATLLRQIRDTVIKQRPSRLRIASIDQGIARLFRPRDGDVCFFW